MKKQTQSTKKSAAVRAQAEAIAQETIQQHEQEARQQLAAAIASHQPDTATPTIEATPDLWPNHRAAVPCPLCGGEPHQHPVTMLHRWQHRSEHLRKPGDVEWLRAHLTLVGQEALLRDAVEA